MGQSAKQAVASLTNKFQAFVRRWRRATEIRRAQTNAELTFGNERKDSTASVILATTVDRIRPPSHYVDYSRVPRACDRRRSTSRSSVVAQASEGVTLATVYSDDGEPSGREFDRRNFKAIRGISRAALEEMTLDLVDPERKLSPGSCRVRHRTEGSFHHAVFLKIDRDDGIPQEYVLKIPAHGTTKEWGMNDRMMLECEAQLLKHIRHHTDCPVPEVVAFDGGLNNAIGAPYILMKKIKGIAATDLWLGQPYRMFKSDDLHLEADDPSPEVEQKRVTFLRSLAKAMSQLATLEFPYTGVPSYEYPEDKNPKFIAPAWRWHCKMNMEEPTSYGSFASSEAFFAAGLDRLCEPENPLDSDGMTELGVQIVMRIILSSAPFKPSTPSQREISQTGYGSHTVPVRETFVIRHDDLDLQNILVDEDGNVTGIIDWDACAAVPRCIGYTSMPTFLRRDWLPDYGLGRLPHMTWAIERYREVYTQAMEELCQSSDVNFTRKSAMYQLVLAALDKDFRCRDVVKLLLREMPEYRRVDVNSFCRKLGQGWPAAEKALRMKMAELLKPE
ncbi:uncharacterized protein J4E78_008760 [Alternaria triticimaculans]|uniref:uncharacterized protein n=1 Tax=Alternaria triticimaculans TaxID=297637 RepID=UPI0020C3D578|nr:uncharacterized protein J4E78_008760 [Alternaria triticimaculans]KAI4648697.1 hypothetical protein J4E78_008760 [Alternaria triticimaculans]